MQAIFNLWYVIIIFGLHTCADSAKQLYRRKLQMGDLPFFDNALDNFRNCSSDLSKCLFGSEIGIEDTYEPCRCDNECERYGDCCMSRQLPLCSSNMHPQQNFECRDLSLASTREQPSIFTAYWIISTCRDGWLSSGGYDRQEILSGCLDATNTFPPVSDSVTGHVYANEYCAICNAVENVVVWRYDYICRPEFNELMSTPGIVLTLKLVSRYCSINMYRPPLMPIGLPPRLCYPQVTNTCLEKKILENLTGMMFSFDLYQDLHNRCTIQPFQGQVLSQDLHLNTVPYRNQYCAFCNGIGITESLLCYKGPPGEILISDIGEAPPVGFSFTLLLDINGNTRSLTASYSVINTTISVSCLPESHSVFDPIQMQCRETVMQHCRDIDGNMSFAFGNCSCKETLFTLTKTDNFAYTNNNMVLFNSEKFEIKFNNSLGDPVITLCSLKGSVAAINTLYVSDYSIIKYIGCSLSIIGCFFILLTYSLFTELRTMTGIILMNLATATLVEEVLYLVSGPNSKVAQIMSLCVSCAMFAHYIYLCMFFWMSIMCFEILRTFYNASRLKKVETKVQRMKIFKFYLIYGWGISLVIPILSIILNYTTDLIQYGSLTDVNITGECFINHEKSFIITFILPASLSLIFCWIALTIVMVYLFKSYRTQAKLQKDNIPFLRLSLAMFAVSGPSWLLGCFALISDAKWLWYAFQILNTCEGMLICFAFLSTQRILLLYKNRFKLSIKSNSQKSSVNQTITPN